MYVICFLLMAVEGTSFGGWHRVHSTQTKFTVWVPCSVSRSNFIYEHTKSSQACVIHCSSSNLGLVLIHFTHVPYLSSRTKAGMTSAAESITESLRRTRQLMVQVSVCIFLFSYPFSFFSLILLLAFCNMVILYMFVYINRRWKEAQEPSWLLVGFF